MNGLVFSDEDFGGDGGGAAGADSTMGLDGIGGGVVGEMLDKGALMAPTFRFKCISKSPTYHVEHTPYTCHIRMYTKPTI